MSNNETDNEPQAPVLIDAETGSHQEMGNHQSHIESEGVRDHQYELGQWFWVKGREYGSNSDEEHDYLVCLMKIGSNFYELDSPHAVRGGHRSWRFHHDDSAEGMRYEPNAAAVIQARLQQHQNKVQALMNEVQAITARLGVDRSNKLGHTPQGATSDNRALSILSGQADIKAYEGALIKAKEETLPNLFKEIESEQEEVARWMMAGTLPLKAGASTLKGSLDEIEGRIYNVSLYAGLEENIIQIAEGEPAPMGSKLHVMQRRLYMDEECLLGYKAGGLEFANIREFDSWLLEPDNLNRILPFERCMVAMRVRRNQKHREYDGTLSTAMINLRLEKADKLTFMYIRNGENVYCLESSQDFGELIFPAQNTFDPSEPVMVKMWGSNKVDKIITRREYDDRVKATEEWDAKYEQWKLDNPFTEWQEGVRQEQLVRWEEQGEQYHKLNGPLEDWLAKQMRSYGDDHSYHRANPFGSWSQKGRINAHEYRPFDDSNVYYDTIAAHISGQIREYNRIALIIQGLFDRSGVLHPHPPVKTWDPASFSENITLVYDGSALLFYGDEPDIDGYIAKCNESLKAGCVTVGQEDVWLLKEGEKERNRRLNSWRENHLDSPERFSPYGNDGPGYIARIERWKPKSREASYSWHRQRMKDTGCHGERYGDPIRTTVTVPGDKLFNCDAYQLGDFKQFFRDPRTRAKYLKWAPMLIAAEEYQAGNLAPQEPVEK